MTSGPSTTYTLASNGSSGGNYSFRSGKNHGSKHNNRHHHRKSNSDLDEDPTDGQGSLTYSATSSVQSGGSAAGESTDSSFADIMRVLDLQDGTTSKEFQALLKKEGVSSASELKEKRGYTSAVSVASSLNYSTDGESHLAGSQLLQTIAGQPSDSYAFDGGGSSALKEEPIKTGDNDIMFAPAEPANVKKKKKKHRDANGTPKTKNSSKRYDSSPSPSTDTPTKSPPSSETKPGTPPPLPPKGFMEEDDEDIWYAKWWMSCFPDSFKNLMPKR